MLPKMENDVNASLRGLLHLFEFPSALLGISPTLRPPREVWSKRTATSTRGLRRAEVLGRVKAHTLRLVDKMPGPSYRKGGRN